MEHRADHRTHASMKLIIYKADTPAATAVTRDISREGMFVLTNFVDIDRNQPLEFELLFDRKYSNTRKRYRTYLYEKRSDGLVLRFEEAHKQDARKLAAMVEWVAASHASNRLQKPRQRCVYISDFMSAQNAAVASELHGLGEMAK